jgi:nucleotidyltransferase/DNA polymerase involved in DNA repair
MKIACVLTTHLPMKAELRRRADLRGRPVLVTESVGSKQVVLDASPEAAGAVVGMPLQEAISRCKGAVLLQADLPYYHSVFDRVAESLGQRSPRIEKAELGCVFVGLDGLEAMYGGVTRLITALAQAVPHGLGPRIGVGEGKFPAYIAAVASGAGRATRVPTDVAGFLKDFSVDLLPISWNKKERLRGFGLHTIGSLAALPVGSVQAQLGTEGKLAWDLAHGVDRSPLVPHSREESVSEFLTFPSPATSIQAIVPAIEILLGRAFARPVLRGRHIRTAYMQGGVMNRPPWTKRFAFKDAINNKARALSALRASLETVEMPGALEDMRLTLSGITGDSGVQASLFSDMRRQEQLRETMRQLEARLGARPPIYLVRDVEPWSRIPERRQALVQYDP